MRRSVLFVCLLSVALAGCSSGGESAATNSTNSQPFALDEISSTSPLSGAADLLKAKPFEANTAISHAERRTPNTRPADTSPDQSPLPAGFDRKVVRDAQLDLESESPEELQRRITAIAESNGGFVVESNQSTSDISSTTRDIVTMTLRVPSGKFNQALEEIRSTADRIVAENVKGQDVTEEFIDIEARLKAKRSLEAQVMEIMKRANTIEEAFSVQRQLSDVRGEIERIEGRKRFLEDRSSLSTIRVRAQTPRVFAASSRGFGDRLSDSFGSGLDVALNFVLGLVTFAIAALPFIIFIGLPGWFMVRYLRKRQARPWTVSEIAREEIRDN